MHTTVSTCLQLYCLERVQQRRHGMLPMLRQRWLPLSNEAESTEQTLHGFVPRLPD